MRSLPIALLWETLAHGRWSLLGFLLLSNLMPMALYGSLSKYGIDPNDRAFLMLQSTMLAMVIFLIACGIVSAQGTYARLFALPISAISMVAWQMFSGAVLIGGQVAFASWLYNTLFNVGWPVLGSALFAVTAWCASQLLLSSSAQQSVTGFVVSGTPVIFLFVWLQARYGGWFIMPTHSWPEVNPSELVTMILVSLVSFPLCVMSVNRVRCGERLIPSLGITKWVASLCESLQSNSRSTVFRSPEEAHFWYEWKLKGYALPILVIGLLTTVGLIGLATWISGVNSWQGVHQGILFCGGFVSALAIGGGFFLGIAVNSSASGQARSQRLGTPIGDNFHESTGHFLATRPFANVDFAKVILRVAAQSSLIAWGIWLLSFVAILGLMGCAQQLPKPILPASIGAWYLPLTLLGPWIAMANLATLGLSGRAFAFTLTGIILLTLFSVVSIVMKECISDSAESKFNECGVVAASTLAVIAALWSFNKARRERIFGWKVLTGCVMICCAIVVIAILSSPLQLNFIAYCLIVAFATLVVLPFATTPLAIRWNRHR